MRVEVGSFLVIPDIATPYSYMRHENIHREEADDVGDLIYTGEQRPALKVTP